MVVITSKRCPLFKLSKVAVIEPSKSVYPFLSFFGGCVGVGSIRRFSSLVFKHNHLFNFYRHGTANENKQMLTHVNEIISLLCVYFDLDIKLIVIRRI